MKHDDDGLKEDEIHSVCIMHGRNAKCAHNFSRKTEKKKPVLIPMCMWNGSKYGITITVKEI
jgi:hypothetical protein